MAFTLESQYEDQILELYVNTIYFGVVLGFMMPARVILAKHRLR